MTPLASFFAFNRRLSWALENRLPERFKQHLHTLYKHQAAALANRRPGQIILDVGGGKDCPFVAFLNAPETHVIVALDCSEEELRQNHQLELRVVGDAASRGLPFRDGSFDIIVSRSVVEHIYDNAAYFQNCTRALSPGGVMVHAFPGRFAPFALLNQVLPNRLVRRLIGYLLPEWIEDGNYGFLAFYNRCYYSAIKALLEKNGLKNVKFVFTYYQSLYFTWFFPLFSLMLAYDLVLWRFGIRNLASGILVFAERTAAESPRGYQLSDIVPAPELVK